MKKSTSYGNISLKNEKDKKSHTKRCRSNLSKRNPVYFGILLVSVFLSLPTFSQTPQQPRDGKLLRGEKWQAFKDQGQADFYVSNDGNDAWSGTLAEPNASKTDGPFLTIARAQKAVRELKSKVYFPKDIPVEKRWIGSPHPLGRGKDILVYIRQGQYSLKQPLVFGPEDGGERVETNLPTGAF